LGEGGGGSLIIDRCWPADEAEAARTNSCGVGDRVGLFAGAVLKLARKEHMKQMNIIIIIIIVIVIVVTVALKSK
jgi:hypothetical protein